MRQFIKRHLGIVVDMVNNYIESLDRQLNQADELSTQTLGYAWIKFKVELIKQMKKDVKYVLSRL